MFLNSLKEKSFYPYVDILNVYYEDVAIFVDDGLDLKKKNWFTLVAKRFLEVEEDLNVGRC